MDPFEVVIPTNIHRISVRRRTMPGGEGGEVTEELTYDGGFNAGYKAGTFKAEREAYDTNGRQQAEVEAVLRGLQQVQKELLEQAKQNFPPLIMAAIDRVFKAHQFTEEEIAKEVGALLKEVVHAQSISIECCPQDLDRLQKTCERLGLTVEKGIHSWKANPTLKRGEFVLQTDLGSVDGRRLTKLSKIKAVLDP
jgi:flagellar biosynthesis/type III secretory pathway protein FliH